MPAVRRFFKQLFSLNGTPVGIAAGFCLGVGCSLVPIPFLGMFLALALAPLLRLNLPATYLGTALVNPFTGSLFYFGELWLGMTIVGKAPPPWSELRALDPRGWWNLATELTLPFAIGAGCAIVLTTCVLFPLLWGGLRVAQRRRNARASSAEPAASTPRVWAEQPNVRSNG